MESLETQIENKLYELGDRYISSKKIVLFGAGIYSRQIYKLLEEKGYSVHAVIDNNKSLEGHLFMNTVIQHTQSFLKKFDCDCIFLILSRFYQEMKKQLEGCGYIENEHIFQMAYIDSIDEWHIVDEERIDKCILNIRKGRTIHDQLTEAYGTNTVFFVNPVASIGDVYLMSFYIDAYLKDNPDSVFIFGSRVLERLAAQLGFGRVVFMKLDQIQSVIDYAKVFGFEKINIKLLHTGYIHFRIWSRMLTYVGLTWMEHYRELFGVPDNEEICVRKLSSDMEDVKKTFEEHRLKPGKTVVLSPYANTIRQFSSNFWCRLANKLLALGYGVCTNIGSPREKEVPGTVPVCVGIDCINDFVKAAGYFIGIRSGLCDILCTCECLKIILYSDEIFDLISVYDFYSMEKMGFGKNVLEFVVKDGNEEKVIENIENVLF